jgi:hypothetical protein
MSYTDLSGLFQIQKNYLTGINTNDPDLANKVKTIQQNLDKLNTSFASANISSSKILERQSDIANIIGTEFNRLNMKEQNINAALDGKKRIVLLNESYRQRYIQYTKMIIIIVLTIFAFILIVFAGRYFTIIPSLLINILCIIIIAIGLINCYIIYGVINSRDRLNFNELNLPSPVVLTPQQIAEQQQRQGKNGNLLDSINLNYCVGNNCCSDGTVWDSSNGVCVIGTDLSGSPTDSKPTDDTGSNVINLPSYFKSYFSSPSANSRNEYESYSNYK